MCLIDECHGNKLLQVGKWLDLYHAETTQLFQSIWISSNQETECSKVGFFLMTILSFNWLQVSWHMDIWNSWAWHMSWALKNVKLNTKLRLKISWEENFWAGRREKSILMLLQCERWVCCKCGLQSLTGPKWIPCQLWLGRWQELVLKQGLTHRGEWETSPRLNSYSVKTVSDSWQEFTSWPASASSTVLNHDWRYNVVFVGVCYANSNLHVVYFVFYVVLLRRKWRVFSKCSS